ncbi:MAG: oxidase [Bacteroidetes bacterium CG12_big_fil_rev_8_21_14_0_65_60_17]|nr:MAG: oxidase [Bacteroidetes bacterium CG12_big_fil_rev_8_21_14_0_65_60_17]
MSHAEHHITPIKTLVQVIVALFALTILTVATSRLDLGAFDVLVALAIALTKGALVVSVFMALKYDNKVNAVVFGIGALFVIVFLAFTLFDTAFRGDLSNTTEGTIMEQKAAEEALQQREPDPAALQFNRSNE